MKKKFFVVAASLALTMAVTCPAMADVVTGSTDAEKTVTTDGWWKDFSDYYKLSGNFDVTFTIDNKGGTKPGIIQLLLLQRMLIEMLQDTASMQLSVWMHMDGERPVWDIIQMVGTGILLQLPCRMLRLLIM